MMHTYIGTTVFLFPIVEVSHFQFLYQFAAFFIFHNIHVSNSIRHDLSRQNLPAVPGKYSCLKCIFSKCSL